MVDIHINGDFTIECGNLLILKQINIPIINLISKNKPKQIDFIKFLKFASQKPTINIMSILSNEKIKLELPLLLISAKNKKIILTFKNNNTSLPKRINNLNIQFFLNLLNPFKENF